MARKLLVLLILIVIVLIVLVWSGFLRVNTQGSLRAPEVTAKGGEVPSVSLESKKVVVGTRETTVEVPTVGTKERTVQVPTIGVQDGNTNSNAGH